MFKEWIGCGKVKRLPREFYDRPSLEVAKDLLGKILVHESLEGVTSGKIVEVEAYNGAIDKASHAYKNLRTKRTEIQFGKAGFTYIYLVYGMHYCFNVVTDEIEKPGAVLVRALEPVDGLDIMCARRGFKEFSRKTLLELSNGPGKLCSAMGITKEFYGSDLVTGSLYVVENSPGQETLEASATPRIGINYAGEDKQLPWRFIIANSPFISMKKFSKEYLDTPFNKT